jgi:hypothetical protein
MMKHLAAAILMLAAGIASAAELEKPAGPVILTVHGNVENTNRGPLDPFHDALLNATDVAFDEAAEFDRDMLAGLGMQVVETGYGNWPGKYRFEGPLLRDVLAAVGAEGRPVTAYALDGYGAQIPAEKIEESSAILALKRDGQWLGLGGHGPSWVILPYEQRLDPQSQEDAGLVWAVVRIEVE